MEDRARSGAAAIQATSDEHGFIHVELPTRAGQNNDLLLAKTGYLPRLIDMDQNENELTMSHHKRMDLIMTPLSEGLNLANAIGLEPIYFDVESWKINERAALHLERIAFVMKRNPKVHIEVGSHTDSKGSAGFNDVLSEMRANASRDFLISNGVDASRIEARGYGEAKPVNRCRDGVPCSEEEHRLNRRTEFIVVSL